MNPPPPDPLSLLSSRDPDAVGQWTRLPYRDGPRFNAADLHLHWPRLHVGQGLPPPPQGPLAEGWALYHSGDFERAAALGLAHAPEGLALANQATAIYANYLEPRESVRQALFKQVAERATAQLASDPDHCQALYWQAYALGRYSQGISVARALAQGLGTKVKGALEHLIELRPQHADAHVALAAFHAEVIDKVGSLVGRMTYGVRADAAVALFERGLQLNPHSASALIEYARGLLMLHGDSRMPEATRLYEKAAHLEPADARERLDVELARAGLTD
jgi:tetratricopeptide (TPR) repeat protein